LETVRIWFEKTGTAKYISHLDLNRAMTRTIRKARLPVWYTEGFNPHPFITFALPLALGVESRCETMDVRLVEMMNLEQLADQLNKELPPGLYVTGAAPAVKKAKEIALARYEIRLSDADMGQMAERLSQKPLPVMKKSKSGMKEIDLSEKITQIEIGEQTISLTLPAGSQDNINPFLVLGMLDIPVSEAHITRIAVLDEQGQAFL